MTSDVGLPRYRKSAKAWMAAVNQADDLVRIYYQAVMRKKTKHLLQIWTKSPEGHGLECAFGSGAGLYWLSKLFPYVTYDAFDWCVIDRIRPMLYELHAGRLMALTAMDARKVVKTGRESYGWVQACDFLEHLPDEVYWPFLRGVFKVLKPGGLFGVYVGRGRPVWGHIRIVPIPQTVKEVTSVGFERIHDNLFRKPRA